MKLTNNITREYQALPEEMLNKRQVLFIVKQPISLPFHISQLVKSLPFYIPEALFGRSLPV